MIGRPVLWLVLVLSVVACRGGTADHELLGDEFYTQGEFLKALAEYQTGVRARPDPVLWAKAGAAALRAGDLPAAIDAYLQLGLGDPTRQQEAARGLERVIRSASRADSGSAIVGSAMVALRRAAPDRPISRAALRRAGAAALGHQEAVSILPAILAVADGAQAVDRLLVSYGRALESTTACEAATRAYRTAMRRASDTRLKGEAQVGLGACALQLGWDALDTDQPARAEDWFATALLADTVGPVSQRARLGLGDARSRNGDLLGAAMWWGGLLAMPNLSDSLRLLATERLNAIATAEPPPTESEDG